MQNVDFFPLCDFIAFSVCVSVCIFFVFLESTLCSSFTHCLVYIFLSILFWVFFSSPFCVARWSSSAAWLRVAFDLLFFRLFFSSYLLCSASCVYVYFLLVLLSLSLALLFSSILKRFYNVRQPLVRYFFSVLFWALSLIFFPLEIDHYITVSLRFFTIFCRFLFVCAF